jgi:hypothetical protein
LPATLFRFVSAATRTSAAPSAGVSWAPDLAPERAVSICYVDTAAVATCVTNDSKGPAYHSRRSHQCRAVTCTPVPGAPSGAEWYQTRAISVRALNCRSFSSTCACTLVVLAWECELSALQFLNARQIKAQTLNAFSTVPKCQSFSKEPNRGRECRPQCE